MSYEQGFTDRLIGLGADIVFEKFAQAIMPNAPEFDADQFRAELAAMNPDDITGKWIGSSMDSYYGGPEKVRGEFGWTAPLFYDDEETRNSVYEVIANTVRELKRKQMEQQEQGQQL